MPERLLRTRNGSALRVQRPSGCRSRVARRASRATLNVPRLGDDGQSFLGVGHHSKTAADHRVVVR
jgi:hypothetical protein